MAQQRIHPNLTAKAFPFNFNELSSTIVVSTAGEQNRTLLPGFDGDNPVAQFGICQAYFLSNVLPISRGYSSAHYRRQTLGHGVDDVFVDNIYDIRDENGNVALFSPARGSNLVYDGELGAWTQASPGLTFADRTYVSYLKGKSYIFFPNVGLYTYNFSTKALDEVSIPALDMSSIEIMLAVGPLMVAFSKNAVFWSSYLDPTDFTPSQSTGAGSTSVLDIRSEIITVAVSGTGFIIYTARNAVGATPTGNILFPFTYKEIPGAVGIGNWRHVTQNTVTGAHICWTPFGFQSVEYRGAETIWPELTEGITRGIMPQYNISRNLPEMISFDQLDVKINLLATRYICISLRSDVDAAARLPYSTCFVYDTLLERWGKLDVNHVDVFEYVAPDFARSESYDEFGATYATYDDFGTLLYADLEPALGLKASIPNRNFAIVKESGEVFTIAFANTQIAEMNDDDAAGVGVPSLYLGKYKVHRESGLTSEAITINHLHDAEIFFHSHDYNGHYVASRQIVARDPRVMAKYFGRLTGTSVSVQLRGRFTLTDLELLFSPAGRKNNPKRPNSDTDVAVDGQNVVVNNNQVVMYDD